jgi:hypothetical protein
MKRVICTEVTLVNSRRKVCKNNYRQRNMGQLYKKIGYFGGSVSWLIEQKIGTAENLRRKKLTT